MRIVAIWQFGYGIINRTGNNFMAKLFKTKQAKKRMIAVLAVTLATSLSVGVLAACDDSESSEEATEEETTTSTRTDTQLIQNGNFELYEDIEATETSKKVNLISAPDNWTNSYGTKAGSTAPASESKSGIVNTAEWENFTKPGRPFTSKDDALANWTAEGVTAYDRIKAYADFDIDSVEDFEYYDDYKYTVDFDDIKNFYNTETNAYTVNNPGVHAGAKEGETSVLMIQNKKISNSQVYGTAQQYASSTTLTIASGTAAELSVWVKTSNLTHLENLPTEQGAGAFISVTNTVGGTTLDALQIKNINTEKQTASTEWVKYTLYVRASTFATSTIQITLGLGMGSAANAQEMVDGYAFFDDLTCTLIESDEFETKTNGVYTLFIDDDAEDKIVNADTAGTNRTLALDLKSSTNNPLAVAIPAGNIGLTEEESNGGVYTSATYPQVGLDKVDESVTELTTVKGLRENAKVTNSVKTDFTNYPFGDENSQVLLLMSYNGAPYTAKLEDATNFKLEKEASMLISFFVKTSEMHGCAGAGVALVDGTNKTSITPFDSTAVATVDIKNQTETKEDIFDGWVQCFFFVTNDTKQEKTFHLEFTYGSTTITGTTKDSYISGYAAFANFETQILTDREVSYATTGTYAVKATLVDEQTSVAGQKFDSTIDSDKTIETDIAHTANYWGVVGGNKRVGGTDESAPDTPPENVVYAGLLNKEYAKAYYDATPALAWKETLIGTQTKEDWWTNTFGTATQPLAIINKADAAYGFIARSNTSVAADTAHRVSVDVKASEGAVAYVYLIDASNTENGFASGLKTNMPSVTYWYDDDGNVLSKDPASKDFNHRTDVAFNLTENGLYKHAQDANDNNYYTNLAKYKTDEGGNLVNEDGKIAFYANEGKFYAYYDVEKGTYSTQVFDFPETFKAANARYYAPAEHEAVIKVTGTGEWVNVSFAVKAGSDAKNFRVEVWSGSRDGAVKNKAGSYVLFNNLTSAAIENYDTLVTEAEKQLEDKATKAENEVVERYTFTFFDDAAYLRYDETQDTENKGNPYKSYVQSEKTEGIAYLFWEDATGSKTNYRMFFNYGLSDVTVQAETTDEETEEETTDEEKETDPASILLLASSIALVAALVIVIVSIVVQKIVKKRRKARGYVVPVKVKK